MMHCVFLPHTHIMPIVLNFGPLCVCSGPCNIDTPERGEHYFRTSGRKSFDIPYYGHTTHVITKNGFWCKPCEQKYDAVWDELQAARDQNDSEREQYWLNHFELDAKIIIKKFTANTKGAVHYLCSEHECDAH